MKALTAGHHDRVIAGALAVRDKAPAMVTSSASLPATRKPSTVKKATGGAAKGAAVGAEIGSVVPGVGTAAGAVVGGVTGGAGGVKKAHKEKKAARSAKRASLGPGRKALVAEFLVCVAILALSPLTDKHKSEGPQEFMKRGASIMALFFILGLVSAGGKGATKVAVGFGGVVTLALLVSSRSVFAMLAARFGGGPGVDGTGDLGPDSFNVDQTPNAPGILPDGTGSGGPNAAGAGGGLPQGGVPVR